MKSRWVFVMIIVVLLVTGCTTQNEREDFASKPCKLAMDADMLAEAVAGKLKGVGPAIGDSLEKWNKIYGEPDSTGIRQACF
ncbi:hypothetical protein [Paenibacillus sp. L3-i20]|uniref:hypothetical protein n=1 Tax=Paenibacillus sp. L3-i20 TaxID=2905833 RepID=UPI001EDD0FAB|nr:hypothetical protein [Paenibacillus sp. L3-i20]GKU80446.1 hypothetical protein L3i20_v248430 [Paenibacillus sp. L3-i20]